MKKEVESYRATGATASQLPQVVLASEQQLLLEGLQTALRTEATPWHLATASAPAELLQLLAPPSRAARVVVLDYQDGTTDLGQQLAYQLHQQYPTTLLLALASSSDYHVVCSALMAGCSGYILRNASSAEIQEGIRQVLAGNTFFSPEVGALLLRRLPLTYSLGETPEAARLLTQRERQILQLVAQEYASGQIARLLMISERTVEVHRRNLLAKTNSKSVIGLIRYALRHQLIT